MLTTHSRTTLTNTCMLPTCLHPMVIPTLLEQETLLHNWAWTTGGAPDAYFGDRTDKRQSGANNQYSTYDSQFSSGGGMHSTVNDYGMTAAISQSGANYNIDITYKYTGSGRCRKHETLRSTCRQGLYWLFLHIWDSSRLQLLDGLAHQW